MYVVQKGKHEVLRKRAPDEENEQDEIKTWRSRLNGLMVEYDMDNSKQLATVRCVNLDYALDYALSPVSPHLNPNPRP